MTREKHTMVRGGKRLLWYTERLWRLSADLPVRQVAIESIPEFQQNCWFQTRPPTVQEVAGHARRIMDADLSFPVILNDLGGLMDGGHRLSKAYLEGQTHVSAVQFATLPEPDAEVPGQFVELKTERLLIREFSANDLKPLFDLYQRRETSEFESWQPYESEEDAKGLLQYFMEQKYVQPRTAFTLAIERDGRFIGVCGLELGFGTETDDLRCGCLSYRIHPDHWRHGLATEVGDKLITFGFERLGLHRIHAGCSANNVASARVLEKLGFHHEGTTRKSFPVGDEWHDYKLYGRLDDDDSIQP